MGYTTDFWGSLKLDKKLTDEQFEYLTSFNETRHVKRDVNKLMDLYKGKYGYPNRTGTAEEIYGLDGEYFVGPDKNDSSVIDYCESPGMLKLDFLSKDYDKLKAERKENIDNVLCQPSLYCQWCVAENEECEVLEWDGGEKFSEYCAWVKYLIKHFFNPWGILLNGEITWNGEDYYDIGKIIVINNEVKILKGKIVYE